MAKRSLQASPIGIKQAKRAFTDKGWTQENLAGEVNLKTRQPVWRFFTGRPIERYTFIEICSVLELNWRETAANPPAESGLGQTSININALVNKVRSQRRDRIQDQCGILQLLDTNRPVGIENIYVDVNILQEIVSQQWLNISDFKNHHLKKFDRFGDFRSEQHISGMKAVETHSKLRILGKPGSGKTTFLQHLAIQSNQGNFASDRVPMFITLRDFADDSQKTGELSLFNYISSELFAGDSEHSLSEILREGRMLLLLDGLDEVLHRDNTAILKEIRRFSEKYSQNLFIVTCRTAAKSLSLKGFTDVEITTFSQSQIVSFAQKWFAVFTKTNDCDRVDLANEFIEKLDLPENLPFRRLAITPLFLHLVCWVFHRQKQFPHNRTEFYKQCLELLLGKWDEIKGIERDKFYQGFSLPQKLELMSQIAAATFERDDYLFEQQTVEQYINDFIGKLPNSPTEPEELQLDSEVVLKAIELQHGLLTERVRGIFSFSSLTFQEYLTARKIVANHLQSLEPALERLVDRITEPRWREIFLLTAAMLRSADFLVQLMKQKIDALIAPDPYLQEFLTWTTQIVIAQPTLAATGAFYLGLTQTPLHPNIQSHWHFSPEQQQVLQHYYDAKQLLVDCLNSNCKLTVEVRQQIETTLLLPQVKLMQKEWIDTPQPDMRILGSPSPHR
ncbi:NACHT domain-containing NTPase [Rivularia sp. UHCC 0363]|uniref:NACHT domain-containing protein n=1 Tax=Rivularia sp. UHCC 0363 TaxID=3110244 RepID=UPI002B20D860|nr:NACHT domain-containing NTPase [Rivularia sp. UHCC 0363]MEA5592849.1 NACHT domain-containing NTPase [Rivularia sp. UHCC 0363]